MDFKLLKRLCDKSGVSGYETEILEFIANEIYDYADDIYYDKVGNLIAFKKGTSKSKTSKKILYSCHADEVGFVINHIADDGRLLFENIGMLPKILPGEKVLIGKNRISGVISQKPAHLVPKDERDKEASPDSLYIDIGAKNRADAEKLGVFADYAVFDSPLSPFGDGLLSGKALDDRIGCALLCTLIKKGVPHDAYFAFCIGEELGLRGSTNVAKELCPDICINLEATTAGDICGTSGADKTCLIRGGVVSPFMDRSAVYSKRLYRLAGEIARQEKIPFQTKTTVAGGTDAGAYTKLTGTCEVLGLALPTRYIHSPLCVAAKCDIEAMEKLLFKIAESPLLTEA